MDTSEQMEPADAYREAVVASVRIEIPRVVDQESPRLRVTQISDTTQIGEAVRLLVEYDVDGADSAQVTLSWPSWDEYPDRTIQSVALGIATMVAVELRERVATEGGPRQHP